MARFVPGPPEIPVRTVARIMALNKEVYDDIPHVRKRGPKLPPQPHPYKASRPHQYWFIDGRMMDFALDGVRWWSLVMLDGYSRTNSAEPWPPPKPRGPVAGACTALWLCAPETLISDSGGAFTSDAFEAVCRRLEIQHELIVSTQGESYKNLMETPIPSPITKS